MTAVPLNSTSVRLFGIPLDLSKSSKLTLGGSSAPPWDPPASGRSFGFTLKIVQDASASGFTVSWPAAVVWPAALAPTLTTTANAVDVFTFFTSNNGTTWYGFTAGLGMA